VCYCFNTRGAGGRLPQLIGPSAIRSADRVPGPSCFDSDRKTRSLKPGNGVISINTSERMEGYPSAKETGVLKVLRPSHSPWKTSEICVPPRLTQGGLLSPPTGSMRRPGLALPLWGGVNYNPQSRSKGGAPPATLTVALAFTHSVFREILGSRRDA
jgi:hypothetical protein